VDHDFLECIGSYVSDKYTDEFECMRHDEGNVYTDDVPCKPGCFRSLDRIPVFENNSFAGWLLEETSS
jgi:hypothetical protein